MEAIVRQYPWLFHAATRRKWDLIRQAGGIDPSLIDEETKAVYRIFYGGTGEIVFFGVPSYLDRGVRMIGSITPDPELVVLRVPAEVIAASGRLELDYTADWGIEAWHDVPDTVKEAAAAAPQARACADPALASLILEETGKLAVFARVSLDHIEPAVIENPEHDVSGGLDWGSAE